LVDRSTVPEYLLERALQLGAKKPTRSTHIVDRIAAPLIRGIVARRVFRQTRGNYPAQDVALEVVSEAIRGPIEHGLNLEREAVQHLATTPECANLMRVFQLQERAKHLKISTGDNNHAAPLSHCAIIGAGVMGTGIAQWLSVRGVNVLLRDIATSAIANGLENIRSLNRAALKRRKMTDAESMGAMDRIQATTGLIQLKRSELVIEAATEKPELKKQIFAEIDRQVPSSAILATNTSALSIGAIAAATKHPERVIGIHFFNPVHKMQLVEVIRHRGTPDHILAATVQFVQRIGKLPVIASDRPGFIVGCLFIRLMR
jgi:3-hydroxyacyl-CoA dehydrogenase/enoyl-CoA hydratase/3-hydroxybutyryl-CoA epimerase